MIQGFSYFPSMVYRDERPEWVDFLLKKTKKYFDEQNQEFHLTQTQDMSNDFELDFFRNYILSSTYDILESQGYNVNRYDFFVSGMWGQEIKNYGGTDVHLHKNSQLCGWIFLETPIGGSYPIYHDTRLNKDMVELDWNQSEDILFATSKIHFNNVIPGTILLSNSWMKHQLSPNLINKSTKVIHFITSCKEK